MNDTNVVILAMTNGVSLGMQFGMAAGGVCGVLLSVALVMLYFQIRDVVSRVDFSSEYRELAERFRKSVGG